MVIAISLVVGITDALSMPSFQSIVPSIVERDRIPSALALNATQFNLSRILGPVAAGLLMASLGAVGCFALNAASYVPFILVALWILPPRSAMPVREAFQGGEVAAGLREIARLPNLWGALLTALATSVLCRPLITFCPVLVKQAFEGNATQFSLTLAGFGIGGIAGSDCADGSGGQARPTAAEFCIWSVLWPRGSARGTGSVVYRPSCAPGHGWSGDEPQQHLGERSAPDGGTGTSDGSDGGSSHAGDPGRLVAR